MNNKLINEKIGFIIINLTPNTDNKILETIKSVEENNVFNSTIIFTSNVSSINNYNLPIFPVIFS